MGKLRIGLLGAGRIGKLHGTNIQNFVPDAEVTMLADPFLNADMEAWAHGIGIENARRIRTKSLHPMMLTQFLSALPPTRMLISSSRQPRPESTSSARSPFTPISQRSKKLLLQSTRQASSFRSVSSAASTEATRQFVTSSLPASSASRSSSRSAHATRVLRPWNTSRFPAASSST